MGSSAGGFTSYFTDPDKRLKVLKVILVGWGVASIPVDIYTGLGLALPSDLPALQHHVSFIYENMLSAIYIPLALAAILAAADPVRHRLLIFFIILSSFTHAGVMTFHVFFDSNIELWSGLTVGSAFLFGTGVAMALFYPGGIKDPKTQGRWL